MRLCQLINPHLLTRHNQPPARRGLPTQGVGYAHRRLLGRDAPGLRLLQVSWVTTVAVVPTMVIGPMAQRTRMLRCGALRRWRSARWARRR